MKMPNTERRTSAAAQRNINSNTNSKIEALGVLKKKSHASLGIIRLDYDYPPAPGDIDSELSFAYDVHYKVVPGLTFAMC